MIKSCSVVCSVALHLNPQTNRDLPTKTTTLRYQTPDIDYEWAKTEIWLKGRQTGEEEEGREDEEVTTSDPAGQAAKTRLSSSNDTRDSE